MEITIRPIQPEEAASFRRAMAVPFGFNVREEDDAPFMRTAEVDRLRAAFDGDQIVGTIGAFTKEVTVPGGQQLPMAGTTMVTVLPTHRRRGVFRALMNEHLNELPEPCAGLWASESSIYGRFGYGIGTKTCHAKIPKEFARLQPNLNGQTSSDQVRLVDIEQAKEILPPLFDAMRVQRPGMLTRSESWWTERVFGDPEFRRMGSSAARYAVCYRDDQPVGYIIFRYLLKMSDEAVPKIVEIISTDNDAHRCLWHFMLGIDLASHVEFPHMPVDDPIVWWLTNPRRLQQPTEDAMWFRPLDVAACLSARRYSQTGTLNFQFQDEQRPDNNGAYCLTVDESGCGSCRRIESAAETDLMLTPFSLGTIYLSAHSVWELAQGGVISGSENSIHRAQAMFQWHQKPWCDSLF